ncbi:MAG: inositol-3-phosphate synthase [Jaaginema sp. PMC 1079.18]|nr:inositol-3-phosphate synthase [Jaaginema sp. PMC 1080.18]MEC4851378.1 inositol-3-phosphate synthase [Jaaginema sp. PMC 1079.18]MEC4866427.1 inositol-3-phosphate synthase [Jaaginema sp. PMC 1078.18]
MTKIKVAIVGIGNCASALIQGIYYYRNQTSESAIGLMRWEIGGYQPQDIEVVAAFDIDQRKVSLDLAEAIFASPNCTANFYPDLALTGVTVQMGKVLDGVGETMTAYDPNCTFIVSDRPEATQADVIQTLQQSQAEILINYLPVGSDQATQFYAECALQARVAFINCIPSFIASNSFWAEKFKHYNIPIIGDDIKSQLGATILHRTLCDLFSKRGVKIERTYQINTGGNTDFLNMLDRQRLASKKISKTEAVQAALSKPLDPLNIHVGPSDYVPWQKDNKVCFIRLEGKLFGDVPMNLELRLSVEDSPNSAGVAIDAIRCCKLALNRCQGGVIHPPSAYFMKHPPQQVPDDKAYDLLTEYIDTMSS